MKLKVKLDQLLQKKKDLFEIEVISGQVFGTASDPDNDGSLEAEVKMKKMENITK